MADIIIELKKNPEYPTAEEPKHRFDKALSDAPWTGTVEATIYVDDTAWEILGYPPNLTATISKL